MTEGETRGKAINTWVQTIGIIVAGLWAIYTFGYRDIFVPNSSVNLSINLVLEKMTTQPNVRQNALTAIQITVVARNLSSREVYLLPTAWAAYGATITRAKPPIQINSEVVISATSGQGFLDKYAVTRSRELLGMGRLLPDTSLRPAEVSTRSLILFIPYKKYDTVDVQAVVPSTTEPDKVDLAWKLTDMDIFTPAIYKLGSHGLRTELLAESEVTRQFESDVNLQTAITSSQICLWPK